MRMATFLRCHNQILFFYKNRINYWKDDNFWYSVVILKCILFKMCYTCKVLNIQRPSQYIARIKTARWYGWAHLNVKEVKTDKLVCKIENWIHSVQNGWLFCKTLLAAYRIGIKWTWSSSYFTTLCNKI